ncbi:MAG TPA: protein phosphatase 2C domain-containing protein [Sandaracinaceae bacterium LLY-WYZ-13_1]|nr:protein phosphatase 2C domain-containing protein [Sandaracinaceae bacterium LLY-WYZ-13_1]
MDARGQFHPGPQTLPNLRGVGRAAGAPRDAAGLTHPGGRERNEDQFLVADVERCVRVRATSVPADESPHQLAASAGTLAAVADGMGGHGSGDLASAVTVDGVLDYVVHDMPWPVSFDEDHRRELLEGFGAAVKRVQHRLWEVAKRKHASPKLGTTLTVAYLLPHELFVGHVGDSRCYVLREGHLTQLTEDHTLAQQARRERPDLDLSHLSHILVNAIGGDQGDPKADGLWVELHPHDRVLLCSDGLTDVVDDDVVADRLARATNAEEAVHLLVRAGVEAGADDNVTAVAAFA